MPISKGYDCYNKNLFEGKKSKVFGSKCLGVDYAFVKLQKLVFGHENLFLVLKVYEFSIFSKQNL